HSPTQISSLSLHDALPILILFGTLVGPGSITRYSMIISRETDEPAIFKLIYNTGTWNAQCFIKLATGDVLCQWSVAPLFCSMQGDRKSTRLNSSHVSISYA